MLVFQNNFQIVICTRKCNINIFLIFVWIGKLFKNVIALPKEYNIDINASSLVYPVSILFPIQRMHFKFVPRDI